MCVELACLVTSVFCVAGCTPKVFAALTKDVSKAKLLTLSPKRTSRRNNGPADECVQIYGFVNEILILFYPYKRYHSKGAMNEVVGHAWDPSFFYCFSNGPLVLFSKVLHLLLANLAVLYYEVNRCKRIVCSCSLLNSRAR